MSITFKTASELLRLDRTTGRLFWRKRKRELFPTERSWKIWNTRFAGKEAMTCYNSSGYRNGPILGKTYRAHQIVWLLHTGTWQIGLIDHINGNRSDNRPSNLRNVTHEQNATNKGRSMRNKSGITGVFLNEKLGKWQASISKNNQSIYLGVFDDINDAANARLIAEHKFGYHENHGQDRN